MLISPHPSWNVLDSTKVNRYRECERAFMYEYLLGWQPDLKSNHLVFGEAWHKAMEYLNLHGFDDTSIVAAYNEGFLPTYRREFDETTDDIYAPKDPFNAQKAILAYADKYRSDRDDHEVLYTEIGGSVPIDEEGRRLHFKMDAILRRLEDKMIIGDEYKTKGGRFNAIWSEEWPLAFQVGTYTHALYCHYGFDEVKGVRVSGAAFISNKKLGGECDFLMVPCWKSKEQMTAWLWTANDLMDRIQFDMERLGDAKEDDSILQAFPMNDRNCTKYFKVCPWHDFCLAWPNPLQHCHEAPLGYHVEYWDPSKKEVTTRMEMEWKQS